jgi:acetyl-CoA decarbonylase/synthase complex subunit gamma
VKSLSFGSDQSLTVGEETVFYRHEKTYVHQTALAVNLNDTDSPEAIEQTLKALHEYQMVRVGETLKVDMIALTNTSEDSDRYLTLVKKAHVWGNMPLVLKSGNAKTLVKAAAVVSGSGCLLVAATNQTADDLVKAATEHGHVLAVTAPDLDGLVELTARIKQSGFNNLVVQFQTQSLAEQFQTNSIARRAALKDNLKPLGYPTLAFIETTDFTDCLVQGISEISKFGSICVLPFFDPALLATLMTARMNIFTDPQKPIQVEPDIYAVGEPGAESPVFVTTNFSLTYFIISGEIENSGISAWLVVPECEGMSVLTSWAAGKFSADSISKFIREKNLEAKVKTRQLIIPGYVSQLSGELEENLPGWKVVVGPQESADLESFITNVLTA